MLALCWGRGYPLLEPDEGRNVEVAREMSRESDFVLPHLNGLPYLDKPATYFATVAIALRIFGTSEGAARLPSLLFTLGTALLVWRFGRRLLPDEEGEQLGVLAAIALLTMPLVLAFSRTVIFDSALLFLETLTLLASWHALEARPDQLPWASLAWAVMGVGAIVKGPVAIIVPLLIVAAYGLIAGVSLRPLFRLSAWPWLFATSLPWFIAVSLRRPDFPRYAFIYESLQRVGTRTHGRGGPIWYFVPVGLAASFPWCVPAIAGLWRGWQERAARRAPDNRAGVFLISWALVPLAFFSLSQSKLPGYYLPALPAIALGAALPKSRGRIPLDIAGLLFLLLAMGLFYFSLKRTSGLPTALERGAFDSFAAPFVIVLFIASWLASAAARRRNDLLATIVLALPTIALPLAGGSFLDAVARGRSSKDLARAIDARAPYALVVGANAWPTSLRFYLDRPVLLATGSGSEMTSNYVVSRLEEFRAAERSPLRPPEWWKQALAACVEPTVFVAHINTPEDSALKAALPLIARGGADEKFAAYGPCRR